MHEKHGHDLSRDDLIREAKMQTDAIQRLNVLLRLGYSLVAIGFLMGMWDMQGGPGWGVPVGIVCLVVGTPLSIVLKVGTTNAKKSVERMPEAAGVDVEELMRRKKDEQ